jgi:hypothetical protein
VELVAPVARPDGGCSQDDLEEHGRHRLLYCFAAN